MVSHVRARRGARQGHCRAQGEIASKARKFPVAGAGAPGVGRCQDERLRLALLPSEFLPVHQVKGCVNKWIRSAVVVLQLGKRKIVVSIKTSDGIGLAKGRGTYANQMR